MYNNFQFYFERAEIYIVIFFLGKKQKEEDETAICFSRSRGLTLDIRI